MIHFFLFQNSAGKQMRAKECIDTKWGFLHYLWGCLKERMVGLQKFDSSRYILMYTYGL